MEARISVGEKNVDGDSVEAFNSADDELVDDEDPAILKDKEIS